MNRDEIIEQARAYWSEYLTTCAEKGIETHPEILADFAIEQIAIRDAENARLREQLATARTALENIALRGVFVHTGWIAEQALAALDAADTKPEDA